MIASSIMTTEVTTLSCDDTLDDALKLLWEKRIRVLPIIDDDKKVAGVISPRTLLESILPGYIAKGYLKDVRFAPELQQFINNIEELKNTTICGFLEKDFCSLPPETSVMEVAATFVNTERQIESILILDDGNRLLGIISPSDVFKRLWDYSLKKKEEG